MSARKEYREINTYKVYGVNIKNIMQNKDISQNILAKMTKVSINTIRAYYHGTIKRIDLDVLSRICCALDCKVEDILKAN